MRRPTSSSSLGRTRAQSGVAILVALLCLAIMLVGAVAMLRSYTSAQKVSGLSAIKRDLVQQSERANLVASDLLRSGALLPSVARETSRPASNYSATKLPSNAAGIPLALLSDAAFGAVGQVANDIFVEEQAVRVRWVIDRLCSAVGPELALVEAGSCAVGPSVSARGGSASDPITPAQQPQVMYRLSVRVDGPSRTQVFTQSSIAM